MAFALKNLLPPGRTKQNIGGFTGRMRFSEIADMDVIQAKLEISDATIVNPEEIIEITDDHTWLATKGAWEIYLTRDSGEGEAIMNQARDTTGMETKMKGMHPGADSRTLGVLTGASNIKGIAWWELADGKWMQQGTKRYPCELKYNWKSGKQQGAARTCEIEVTAFESTPVIYSGAFTLMP